MAEPPKTKGPEVVVVAVAAAGGPTKVCRQFGSARDAMSQGDSDNSYEYQ